MCICQDAARLEFTPSKFSQREALNPHSIYNMLRNFHRIIICTRKNFFLHLYTALYLITTAPLHLQSQIFPPNFTDLILRRHLLHLPSPSPILSITLPHLQSIATFDIISPESKYPYRVSFMMRHVPRLMLFTPPSFHPRRFDLAAIVQSDRFCDIEAAEQARQNANYDDVVTRLLILVHGDRPIVNKHTNDESNKRSGLDRRVGARDLG